MFVPSTTCSASGQPLCVSVSFCAALRVVDEYLHFTLRHLVYRLVEVIMLASAPRAAVLRTALLHGGPAQLFLMGMLLCVHVAFCVADSFLRLAMLCLVYVLVEAMTLASLPRAAGLHAASLDGDLGKLSAANIFSLEQGAARWSLRDALPPLPARVCRSMEAPLSLAMEAPLSLAMEAPLSLGRGAARRDATPACAARRRRRSMETLRTAELRVSPLALLCVQPSA